jgi:hypothetical protein
VPCSHEPTSLSLRTVLTFSPVNVSESRVDRAADPEWRKRRRHRLPSHNRCRTEIASIASDGIQSRLDEHRQRTRESRSEGIESRK